MRLDCPRKGVSAARRKWRHAGLYEDDFNPYISKSLDIALRYLSIGNDGMNRGRRHNQRQAAAAKFGGIADSDNFFRGFYHSTVGTAFEDIGGRYSDLGIESIGSEKEDVGMDLAEYVLCERPYQREGIFRKLPR